MRPGALAITLVAALAGASPDPVRADAPRKSIWPIARPGDPRPDYLVFVTDAAGVSRSLRPVARPAGLKAVRPARAASASPPVAQATTAGPRAASAVRNGALCGSRRIRGERLASIPGKLRGCGVKNPVRVSSVAGVALSHPAVMDCTTAKALDSWVERGVMPVIGRRNGGLSELRVIADYACRTRNNRPGAKISEHGRGRAIDIAGFGFANGRELSVLDGWKKRRTKKLLKRIHRAACGPFGTVLGPDSDRYHRNHFHLDTARYRGGAYCR